MGKVTENTTMSKYCSITARANMLHTIHSAACTSVRCAV